MPANVQRRTILQAGGKHFAVFHPTPQAPNAHTIGFANSVAGMVLVDGNRLVNLMMDHEAGVTSRLIRLPKLDSDYFDETFIDRNLTINAVLSM
ncbi:MAG: hypothetical protein Q7J46_10660 [Pseudomonas sp.]|nr:hypothetical protein [Pseudomonas sp.]